jgi:translation initiation factor 2B subunit (eIF-2B alpha/beta/delta family)
MPKTVKSLDNLLKDRVSGSSTILKNTVGWVLAQIKKREKLGKIRSGLKSLCASHPSMALLQSFCRHFDTATLTKGEVERWMEIYQKHEEDACRHFAEYLSRYSTILAHSNSSLLSRSLLSVTKSLQIYCTEGRPAFEGKTLAESLSRSKHKVALVTDIAAFALLPQVEILAFGCDVITTRGVVNKIGTAALAQSGRLVGKDSCFVGTTEKIVQEWNEIFLLRQGSASEIYSGKQPVQVQNYYFDLTPPDLVRYVFLETGRFSLSGKQF